MCGVYPQEPYCTFVPVLPEQPPDRSDERLRPSNRREIRVPQFELQSTCVPVLLSQAAADHLGQSCQCRLEFSLIGGIMPERVFVANRLRPDLYSDIIFEPRPGIQSMRFARECNPKCAKVLLQ